MRRIITLTTDFGLSDPYVGSMKGVIYSINPNALITDITHDIPSHDVFKAAFILRNFISYFPEETINLVVVDPGVGSSRRAIAVEADNKYFVGPDNGVFTFVYMDANSYAVFEITDPKYMLKNISSTFHGRDIFAPVAGHISIGVSIKDFGVETKDPVSIEIKHPEVGSNEIVGEVIYVDSFGNCITNITGNSVSSDSRIYVDKRVVESISKSYSDVPEGELLAIIGSSGFLELSVNQGRASELINAKTSKICIRTR
ncbi:SAM-dependent chlorinase/fluorinase [Desulfobacterota bacterium AH_259_B03_O07]|nr:SAM-dependent chlorinase/fluorinase [Desulfobacterota bacterium AH_259_B03_O07]